MSQSGYTPIITYNSSTASAVPTSGNLTSGELAVNTTDKKIYTKDSGGNARPFAEIGPKDGDNGCFRLGDHLASRQPRGHLVHKLQCQ